ncbi:MAG: hypothetical protein LV481_05245 [Methylacidiphilales bacterium]|nr:hypothetical protein [Candidatus Methylacidiphilales bacterium]
MNDETLRRELRGWVSPSPSPVARGRALHRALVALNQAPSVETDGGRGSLAWRFGYAVTILVVIAAVLFWRHSKSGDENLAADREMIQQMDKLFPGQVDAIIEKDGKIDLTIAQTPVVGPDQPLLLVFRHGNETIRVLSYSGHQLWLSLGRQRDCFEILATPTGGVILENEKQVWLASDHPVVEGYRMQACALPAL